TIDVDDPPGIMFTKVLNVPDAAMRNYAELLTRWSTAKIDSLFADVESGALEMRALKHQLAAEIVSIFHGDEEAEKAAQDAARMHHGQAPSDAPTFRITAPISIVDLLHEGGMVSSKSEGRRLVQQGGVRLDGEPVREVDFVVEPDGRERTLQAGKRRFLRLVN